MKKITITTLILLTLILSGCFAKPQTPVNQNQNTNTATTTEEIDTNDWQTYRNKEYGFELRYPNDYLIDKRYSMWESSSGAHNLKEEWGVNKEQETIFDISVYSEKEMESILNNDPFEYKLTGEKVMINNMVGEKLNYLRILIHKNNYAFIIYSSFMDSNGSDGYNEYKNILNTLKLF